MRLFSVRRRRSSMYSTVHESEWSRTSSTICAFCRANSSTTAAPTPDVPPYNKFAIKCRSRTVMSTTFEAICRRDWFVPPAHHLRRPYMRAIGMPYLVSTCFSTSQWSSLYSVRTWVRMPKGMSPLYKGAKSNVRVIWVISDAFHFRDPKFCNLWNYLNFTHLYNSYAIPPLQTLISLHAKYNHEK